MLIISHGFFGREALVSASLIAGDIDGATTVDVIPTDGREQIAKKIDSALSELLAEKGSVIILVDLYGGTPGNLAAISASGNDNIRIIAGLNLSMIIDYAFADGSIDEIVESMISTGTDGIKMIDLSDDNGDDVDIG